MDWDDPTERLSLIEQVGSAEYNARLLRHREQSALAKVNGRLINAAPSRFGTLYLVAGTGVAFTSFREAVDYAKGLSEEVAGA